MRVLFYGGTLQAKLNHRILQARGDVVPFVFDADPSVVPQWDCEIIRYEADIPKFARQCDGFLVCIGNEYRGRLRVEISRRLEQTGLEPVSAIHPTTFLGTDVRIGKGLQTFPRAGIGDFSIVGDYCLIGMNAAIDHHCVIGDGVTIMNSASVLGECRIDDGAAILPNAAVMAHVRIGAGCRVEAGEVVSHDRASAT